MTQTHNLSDAGRRALDALFTHIASINGTSDVSRQFAVNPSSEQRLESRQQELEEFLGLINVLPVSQLKGNVIGLGVTSKIGRRRSRPNLPRKPDYVGSLDGRSYELFSSLFDTELPWELIDAWSEFPDFGTRYSDMVARAIALTRICIGFNGIEAAADTNPVLNPLREDMNIGWLQKLRLERPDHVLGRALVGAPGNQTATGAAVNIEVGPTEGIKNLDALVLELISGMPSWARRSNELTVMCSQDLLDEKYLPQVNRPLAATIDGNPSTSDEIVSRIAQAAPRLGNRPVVVPPDFPERTIFISPTKNLSIYWQKGSRRRFVKDEPENMAALVDYNSVNEGYVIESTDHATLAENIVLTDAAGAPIP